MSESELNPSSTVPVSAPTAGGMLRNARIAAGLSLDDLAARVKVSVSRLQSLEDDRFDEWTDKNLVRALVASVCRRVRIDPAIVLSLLPKAEKLVWSSVASDSAVGFKDRGGFSLRSPRGLARLPLALLALGLALVALAIYVGPWLQASFDGVLGRPSPVAAPAAAPAPADPVLPPDAGPTDTRVGAGTADSPSGLPMASGALTEPASVAPASMAVAAAPSAPLLVFKARGLTWVAVTDAKGVSLLRKTLAAGETASTSGALPLWVVVGRADLTDVEVRGQALKLEPTAPENVARFKVQ
ncbi:MAG: helix-turn-helix domain-containing protein [Rhodoferax sp.]|nr:helix-turn-helix domain-containing protein [Rhodoferax sp.]